MAGAAGLGSAIEGWTAGSGPLYRRLADAVADAVDDGRLAAGTRLPPERHLASALSVSRSTVVAAFEALKRSGHLEARQGSGTWIRGRRRLADEGNRELIEALEDHAILRDVAEAGGHRDRIALTAAAVDCDPTVISASTGLDAAEVTRWSTGHGYAPAGITPLRETVARHLTARGLPTNPRQVLITSGATQGLLLAGRLYLEPGAPVVVETPTYAGAIDVLHALGARLLSVDLDASGARTDQLADVLARALPRLVYLVPDFNNPTGVVLSERRRREVARLAAELHVPVVEDLVQRDLWFDAPPPPPIAAFEPEAPVLTLGSLSKVFWGGLRVGWVRANEATVSRLARMKAVTDFGTPIIAQLVAADLMEQTDAVAARRRSDLGVRLAHLRQAIARHLPDWHVPAPAGGLSVWARLPAARADELARRAADYNVEIVSGTTFAAGEQRHADRIRVPFIADPDVAEEGIRRLARAWADLAEGSRHASPQSLIV